MSRLSPGSFILALRAKDPLWAAIIAGVMAVLFVWHLLEARRRVTAASLQGATGQVALAWAVILVILNLRLQVWLAALSGINLAEMHRRLPMWVIPSADVLPGASGRRGDCLEQITGVRLWVRKTLTTLRSM